MSILSFLILHGILICELTFDIFSVVYRDISKNRPLNAMRLFGRLLIDVKVDFARLSRANFLYTEKPRNAKNVDTRVRKR